jgi:hypothetical protein
VSIAAANGYQTFDMLQNFKADGGTQQAATVARTHVRVSPAGTDTGGASNFYFGLLRGQVADVGVNIAGAPKPSANMYDDWMIWDHLFSDFSGAFNQYGGFQLEYDLKAMRRLEELQMNYNGVIEVASWTAFPAVFNITGRVLLMLP